MKNLLQYVISEVIGNNDFTIEESHNENNYIVLKVKTDPKNMGLLIGKKGRTINSIRNLLRVRATLDKEGFSLEIAEK